MKRRTRIFRPRTISARQTLLVIGVLLLLIITPLHSSEVVIVMSADLPPYRQAQEALRAHLPTEHCTLLTLEQITADVTKLSANANCVVAIGSGAAVWLHERKIPGPLIYCMVSDPLTAGLQKPPTAMGISTDIPPDQQIKLIAETLPQARNIGLLYRSGDERSRQAMENSRALLPPGWKLEAVAIDLQESPAAAIDLLMSRNIDVMWTTPDSTIWNEATVRSLLLTTLRRRVPVFGFSTSFVRSGALFGVGLEPATQGTQAAALVQDVLSGKTLTNTVIPPTFDVCLNLIVAQKLSLTLPPSVVQRATHLFEPGR
jgi:putative tryptophan/tyrosine transport system substrate-binding protein